ncbi:MAG: NAD-dependent deacylase [Opitutales bacterium]|nr:NAD-dependent deacylase [Opitutales bacterium]
MSAESGVPTFRGAGGWWNEFRAEDLATPEAWATHPRRVLDFYNFRRRQLYSVEPNAGHRALAELEKTHRVSIVTQNIDNLHERAGSTQVLHLHGELDVARSSIDPSLLYPLNGRDILMTDRCARGSPLRPHVVWFGEAVTAIPAAQALVETADVLLVVGTSLMVYPAAGLIDFAQTAARCFLVDPHIPPSVDADRFTCIAEPAGVALPRLVHTLQAEEAGGPEAVGPK